jgi:hypothetical protein
MALGRMVSKTFSFNPASEIFVKRRERKRESKIVVVRDKRLNFNLRSYFSSVSVTKNVEPSRSIRNRTPWSGFGFSMTLR